MLILLVVIHVIACIVLIIGILMQSGKGGGLSGTFGGDMAQNILGTNASNLLTKATIVAAIVFLCTCIGLTIVTTQKSKSLVERLPYNGNLPIDMPIVPPTAGGEQGNAEKTDAQATEAPKSNLDNVKESDQTTENEPKTELPGAEQNNQNQ